MSMILKMSRNKEKTGITSRERVVFSCMYMGSIAKSVVKHILTFKSLLDTYHRVKKPILAHAENINVSTQSVDGCMQCSSGFSSGTYTALGCAQIHWTMVKWMRSQNWSKLEPLRMHSIILCYGSESLPGLPALWKQMTMIQGGLSEENGILFSPYLLCLQPSRGDLWCNGGLWFEVGALPMCTKKRVTSSSTAMSASFSSMNTAQDCGVFFFLHNFKWCWDWKDVEKHWLNTCALCCSHIETQETRVPCSLHRLGVTSGPWLVVQKHTQ